MPDDLNDVVSRIAIAVAAHDDPRAAIKRELRAVQAATYQHTINALGRTLYALKGGGAVIEIGGVAYHVPQPVAAAMAQLDRAAALHPKESNDE